MFLPRTIGILGGAFVYHHHHHPHNHHHHHHCHHDYHPHLHYDYITVMIQGIMEMMFSNFCRTEKSRKLFTLTSHHRANIQSSILLMIIFILYLYLHVYLSHFFVFVFDLLFVFVFDINLTVHITEQASKVAYYLCPCVLVFISVRVVLIDFLNIH